MLTFSRVGISPPGSNNRISIATVMEWISGLGEWWQVMIVLYLEVRERERAGLP